ncbi:MAG: tRNA (adenosine(37)-N6)-threonylcarbamoyltransferase complex dimerization subunit type 1 TsaB [Clostridia bacterium]|nr:tRNA (adenosine(37)-N6)-threonylcarbamoyltransferase complex dimerization subunit type 1 TsaB [Clostridia bacterium]
MKILAVDTTAKTAAVALTDGRKLLAMTTLNTQCTHSVTVLPAVESLLKSAAMTVDDIDMLACSAGPGSFTGVRIGVSLVKGLAFGSSKLCIGVSSLEALAHNLEGMDGIICPVMDARRNQLYNALFCCDGGMISRITDDRLITAERLAQELDGYGQRVWFVGDGCAIAEGRIIQRSETPWKYRLALELYRWQNGYSVAITALEKYEKAVANGQNIGAFTPGALSPVYLRASQAEREREEKLSNTRKADK